MKTLKSTAGTFGLIDLTSVGRANTAASDGYADADSIKTTSIYAVSGRSGDEVYLANIPVASAGFLITFSSSYGCIQIFISLNVSMTSRKVINTRRYTSTGWSAWHTLPEMTEVTE